MPKQKISLDKLSDLVREGFGVRQIARKMNVSPGSVSKALKKMGLAINKDVVLRSAPAIVSKNLDTVAQLQKINDHANELLDLLMRWNRGDQEALRILESQVRKVKFGGSEEEISEYRFKDPRELALKAMSEIRSQLKLQLEIFQALYDMQAIEQFQKEVLSVIASISPEARDKIIGALQEKNAIFELIGVP